MIYEESKEKYNRLEKILREINKKEDNEMHIYRVLSIEEAIGYMEEYIDAIFVSLEDRRGNGLLFAFGMRKHDSQVNIIAMAENPVYVMECWEIHVSGYIDGEVTKEKVLDELEHLRVL